MSGERGGSRFGGFSLKICLGIVLAAMLVGACIYVSIPKSSAQVPVGSTATAAPTASPRSTPGTSLKEDTPTHNSQVSSEVQPSQDEIWDFETAYNTTDPKLQLSLLQKVATQQYIEKEYAPTTIDYKGLVVKVNRSSSTYAVVKDSQGAYCEVTTTAALESYRNGKRVASYTAPPHTTLWLNTQQGWKVASEKR